METIRAFGIARSGLQSARPFHWTLILLSLLPICIGLPIASVKIGVAIIIGWIALLWIAISIVRNQFHYVALVWLTVFPYCYYFLSYPTERSIFTIDRTFAILFLFQIVAISRPTLQRALPRDVRVAGWLWAAYLFSCIFSLWGRPIDEVLGSYRLILDGLLLPALLGLYAIRYFPVIRCFKATHACVCLLMLGIAIVAGTEILTGTNLLPWVGAVEEWVRTNDFKIIRVDGPFENSGVLCLIGILGFFFLIYAGHLLGNSLTNGRRLLHWTGVVASLAAAFMPMNRGLVVALSVCAGIDYLSRDRLIARRLWNCIFAVLVVLAVFSKIFYPGVYEDRVSRPDNFYQRIGQHRQTLKVISDNPVMGVGINLYHDTVAGNARYSVRLMGLDALDFPHNSLLAVLAEEGVIGFSLYLAAQLFFIHSMWQLRSINKLGWRVFLYCVLVYTVYGLDVGMTYFSDLNLFYLFILGIVLQVQLSLVPGDDKDAVFPNL